MRLKKTLRFLEEMEPTEAKHFLQKALGNSVLVRDEATVEELLAELTYIPLATIQAASYVVKKSITISRYLALMKKTEKEMIKLLSQDFRDTTREKEAKNAVAVTWLVSFEQIRRDKPEAANILLFLALIEHKAIPLSALPSARGD